MEWTDATRVRLNRPLLPCQATKSACCAQVNTLRSISVWVTTIRRVRPAPVSLPISS